ncbi:MAG: hypothetical protein GXY82_07580 [Methanospirillum sp.]|nr:hypothetical protein [Methanospirillum sp.]
MKGERIVAVLVLLLVIADGAGAIRVLGGEEGGMTVIAEPVDDDVVAASGQVSVEAPIGSLIAVGGEIGVHAPVAGDVIAAGGTVRIDGPVGGKVVLVGGRVDLNGTVERNALVSGGEVLFGPGARIGRDARVSAGTFTHRGDVNGTLWIESASVVDEGSEGALRYSSSGERQPVNWTASGGTGGIGTLVSWLSAVLFLLWTIGFLLLGLLLVALFPGWAGAVESRVREQPLPSFAIGLIALVAAGIVGLILVFTVIGAPIAVFGWLFVAAGIMLAGLVVSLALGRLIAGRTGLGERTLVIFAIGFALLNLVYLVPVLGWLVKFVVVCLGFGALLSTGLDAVSGARRHEVL